MEAYLHFEEITTVSILLGQIFLEFCIIFSVIQDSQFFQSRFVF